MKSEAVLQARLRRQAGRMRKAARERSSLLMQTTFLGGLGLAFVLPVVAGAYLGRWMDGLQSGYSMRWTIGFILLGIGVGTVNVYVLIKRTQD